MVQRVHIHQRIGHRGAPAPGWGAKLLRFVVAVALLIVAFMVSLFAFVGLAALAFALALYLGWKTRSMRPGQPPESCVAPTWPGDGRVIEGEAVHVEIEALKPTEERPTSGGAG